jgi:hypothetical protein
VLVLVLSAGEVMAFHVLGSHDPSTAWKLAIGTAMSTSGAAIVGPLVGVQLKDVSWLQPIGSAMRAAWLLIVSGLPILIFGLLKLLRFAV